jgi:hypothetical protein
LLPRARWRRLAEVAGAGSGRAELQSDAEEVAGKRQKRTATQETKSENHVRPGAAPSRGGTLSEGNPMNRLIYIVGLVVVVMAVLWFFGLR